MRKLGIQKMLMIVVSMLALGPGCSREKLQQLHDDLARVDSDFGNTPDGERYREQWEKIRRSPDEMRGKSFDWRAQVKSVWSDHVSIGYLSKWVIIQLKNPSKYPRLHEDDWVEFTGKFKEVSEGGDLVFAPISIKNLGYNR